MSQTGKTTPFLFGISQFTTWPWTFERDVAEYARLDVDTIEVCEFKLSRENMSRQLASIGDNDLVISSIQPSVRTLFPSKSQPEPRSVADRMDRFKDSIRNFGLYGSGVPFVTNTGIPPDGNIQRVIDVAIREYRSLADFARPFGAHIALEPLNPSIMNLESAIWTVEQAAAIVDGVGRENFGICLDFWNVWQNAGIEPWIRANGSRILVVQVSDWRTPRSDQDRLIPGQGALPLAGLLRAVDDSGYGGAYSVEIFSGNVSDSIWQRDLSRVIVESREGLTSAWAPNTQP
jgi:sugar phosphate isomerase/epimerase